MLTVRQFCAVQEINWDAQSYTELIDLSTLDLEPPVLIGIPMHIIEEQVNDWNAVGIPSVPSNTQAVERIIQLVTKYSA